MKTFAEALNGHIEAMRSLDPTRAPLWGIMSAQHMVEHIAETMRLTRTACVDIKPGARLRHTLQYAFFRTYLRTDLRLPRGVAHPLYGHRLLPLVSPDIDSAIGTIGSEMAELEHFFERINQCVQCIRFSDQWIIRRGFYFTASIRHIILRSSV